ncbi:methyltransferase domain-containing protein [Burkholderia sp. HI2500]|uniref:methyltransferase domain-containing protein n=1 Tax=Burkholderia sp. HI2500 TaxID=2015358 RepID=UPI000B7A8854|nr:methyltransferase domain-containing protein [Burkholderia sp. HI2500]OXJ15735.1 hypothetical protein CFB45_03730 [Burkholderia sp. HI2500]
MHDTAYKIGGLVMGTYLPSISSKILEIGAQNINGTLRDHSPRNAEYVGLDFEAGVGVDIVITGTNDWQVPDAHFDLVIASSVFEHDNAFWRTFIEMCRKVKPGGHIYVSAPSNGSVHRYPKDYWRFYPDSGLALEDLARSEGFDLILVESFIAEREADSWNDFCAVFRRGPCDLELNLDFVHNKVRCTNALNWRSSLIVNAAEENEDMRLLRQARNEVAHAAELQRSFEVRLAELAAQKAASEAHLHVQIGGLTQFVQERDHRIEEQGAQLRVLNEELEKERVDSAASLRSIEVQLADFTARSASSEENLQERIEGLMKLVSERDERLAEQDSQLQALTAEIARERADFAALQRSLESQRVELDTQRATNEERLRKQINDLVQRVREHDRQRDEQDKQLQALTTELAKERAGTAVRQGTFEAALAELAVQKAASDGRLHERFREIGGLTRIIQERDLHIEELGRQLQALTSEIAKGHADSAEMQHAFEGRLAELGAQKAKSDEMQHVFEARLSELAAQKAVSEDRLHERFREIGGLTRLIQERDQHISSMAMQIEWLCRVISVLTKGFSTSSKARALAWLPAYFSHKWQKVSLKKQGLFDSDDYVATYPDVLEGRADPLRHYINHGIKEGRIVKKGHGCD